MTLIMLDLDSHGGDYEECGCLHCKSVQFKRALDITSVLSQKVSQVRY